MQESRRITRKSASNLALAFALLPRERREAMSALYAFCRAVDDVADEDSLPVEQRRRDLAFWREEVRRVCGSDTPELPVNRELQAVAHKYPLARENFEALLDGVEMDLDRKRYSTMEELELYCYRVASVVGLLSIEIFGYQSSVCKDYAVSLGKALQLTNILRDVRNDAQRGRIYLPEAELIRFGVSAEQILRGEWSPQYRELAASLDTRATQHYAGARSSLPPGERPAMVASELMGKVYWSLLLKLRAVDYNVFAGRPVRLSKGRKLALVTGAWFRFLLFGKTPHYGPAPA
jgi:15-cis-phytoene synthase